MGAVPAEVDPDRGPPTAVPLGHFVVGLCLLVAGAVVGLAVALDLAPASGTLAGVHLLLVGWVCVTIMGAMTQFVPVWSGVALHSRRLAAVQVWLVAVGVVGFALALSTGTLALLPVAGGTMLAGLWTFCYNVGRTLRRVDRPDTTERHFALALGFFALLSVLGVSLAADLASPVPVLRPFGVDHVGVAGAHATLAVFGAVLTTVYGALYQLATMFTRTDPDGVDRRLRRVEEAAHPVGVVALAAGRLLGVAPLARLGGVLVALAALAVAAVLLRRLLAARVDRTPLLSRYAVVGVSLAGWALLALPAWLARPLDPAVRFGPPVATHLLGLGVVVAVVAGTLYHVVPFLVWVERYSDRLGYEPVPMVDDLYDGWLAGAEFWLLVGGGLQHLGGVALGSPLVRTGGAVLLTLGAVALAANLLLVVARHAPGTLVGFLGRPITSRRSTEGRTGSGRR